VDDKSAIIRDLHSPRTRWLAKSFFSWFALSAFQSHADAIRLDRSAKWRLRKLLIGNHADRFSINARRWTLQTTKLSRLPCMRIRFNHISLCQLLIEFLNRLDTMQRNINPAPFRWHSYIDDLPGQKLIRGLARRQSSVDKDFAFCSHDAD